MTKTDPRLWSPRTRRAAAAHEEKLIVPDEIAPTAEAAQKVSDWALPLFNDAYRRGFQGGEALEQARREFLLEQAYQRGVEHGRAQERERVARRGEEPSGVQTALLSQQALSHAFQRGVEYGAAAKKAFLMRSFARSQLISYGTLALVFVVVVLAAILSGGGRP